MKLLSLVLSTIIATTSTVNNSFLRHQLSETKDCTAVRCAAPCADCADGDQCVIIPSGCCDEYQYVAAKKKKFHMEDIVMCGRLTCGPHTICCNEYCGICTLDGGDCMQMVC